MPHIQAIRLEALGGFKCSWHDFMPHILLHSRELIDYVSSVQTQTQSAPFTRKLWWIQHPQAHLKLAPLGLCYACLCAWFCGRACVQWVSVCVCSCLCACVCVRVWKFANFVYWSPFGVCRSRPVVGKGLPQRNSFFGTQSLSRSRTSPLKSFSSGLFKVICMVHDVRMSMCADNDTLTANASCIFTVPIDNTEYQKRKTDMIE